MREKALSSLSVLFPLGQTYGEIAASTTEEIAQRVAYVRAAHDAIADMTDTQIADCLIKDARAVLVWAGDTYEDVRKVPEDRIRFEWFKFHHAVGPTAV